MIGGTFALGVILTLWIRGVTRRACGGGAGDAALLVLNTMALLSMLSGTYYYGVPVVLTGLVWGICLSARPGGSQADFR